MFDEARKQIEATVDELVETKWHFRRSGELACEELNPYAKPAARAAAIGPIETDKRGDFCRVLVEGGSDHEDSSWQWLRTIRLSECAAKLEHALLVLHVCDRFERAYRFMNVADFDRFALDHLHVPRASDFLS